MQNVDNFWIKSGLKPAMTCKAHRCLNVSDTKAAIEDLLSRPPAGLSPWFRPGSGRDAKTMDRQPGGEK